MVQRGFERVFTLSSERAQMQEYAVAWNTRLYACYSEITQHSDEGEDATR